MTIRNLAKVATLDPTPMEMLELSADDLDKVAGGATTVVYVMRPIKVIGNRPKKQQVGASAAIGL